MTLTLHIITGVTAVGKTHYALDYCEAVDAEIISCDASLFYQGMDIGTAKPTKEEMAKVPHHCIDINPVNQSFNITQFDSLARRTVENIISRVNPLQPWPTPIKAKLSFSNFSLAWISSLLVLIGIFQITLGGIGLSGFFTLRELYFISSNTFEALIKLGTGLLLLNLTIRRVDLKFRILIISAALQALILITRNLMFDEISEFDLYFSSGLIIFFIYIAFINRNYKTVNSV